MLSATEQIRAAVRQAMAVQRDLDYRVQRESITAVQYGQEKDAAIEAAVNELYRLLDRR